MPSTGGYCPGPFRTGGAIPRLKRVVESLETQRGTAYASTPGTAVFVENMAIARAIDADVYGANERLANSFDPNKTSSATGMLQRWEAIFGLTPSPTDTDPVRRARLLAKWQQCTKSSVHQAVVDALTAALGPVFVGITFVTPTSATQFWPGNNGSVGGITNQSGIQTTLTGVPAIVFSWVGSNITISNASTAANNGTFQIVGWTGSPGIVYVNPSGVSTDYGVGGTSLAPTIRWVISNPFSPWTSTVGHIDIQVQQPSGYSLTQFFGSLSAIGPLLDAILPAWTTWDWWMPSPHGAGGMGFYLDDPNNLDMEVFRAGPDGF
jgi:hypothetical protein